MSERRYGGAPVRLAPSSDEVLPYVAADRIRDNDNPIVDARLVLSEQRR